MKAIGLIQTSWTNIRIVLYRTDDGLFQFLEESTSDDGAITIFHESGLFSELDEAKEAMIDYAVVAEDDLPPPRDSVVILDPSSAKL